MTTPTTAKLLEALKRTIWALEEGGHDGSNTISCFSCKAIDEARAALASASSEAPPSPEGARAGQGSGDGAEKLWDLCVDFIRGQKISCPEATVEDRVYEHAPELVEKIGEVVGFYRYPEDEA